MEEKLDNILNLTLELSGEDISSNPVFSSGVDLVNDRWELIIRYVGEEDFGREYGIDFVRLMGGYGIATLPKDKIDAFVRDERIIFVEKSKPLLFALARGISSSCINPVTENFGLHGEGVIVAIIDSGIDYENNAFRKQDGSTRILELWDQSIEYKSVFQNEYKRGRIFTQDEINEVLLSQKSDRLLTRDFSGHGTMVAGIAAGNFASNRENNVGIATKSELLIVKLGVSLENSFPRTIELMEAIDYVVKRGVYYNRPVVINLSFGNVYGSHDGTSLLETFMDYAHDVGRNVICVGTGNEGDTRGHTEGKVEADKEIKVEFVVSSFEQYINIQLWKEYSDVFDIEILSPTGINTGVIKENTNVQFEGQNERIQVFYGTAKPYSQSQEVFISIMAEQDEYITEGIWNIIIVPKKIVDGRYDLWISAGIATGTGFVRPTPDVSLTIPSSSNKSIGVGAYDTMTDRVADFSGRGFTINDNVKPDIVAPGVNIITTTVGGGTISVSGTSFATPFVSGSAALLMEWGIVRGNDPFLYGEKVKAYLQRGARQLPLYEEWPNSIAGFGALCLKDSIPQINDK